MGHRKPFYTMDGAKGSLALPFIIGRECADDLPETNPHLVRGIHTAHLRAGAELIQTMTFTTNGVTRKLDQLSDDEIVTRTRNATRLAREAADPFRAKVGVSIGPLGGELFVGPGALTHDSAVRAYKPQIIGGLEAGADVFMLETIGNLDTAKAAVEALRQANSDMNKNTPMTVTMNFGRFIPSKGFRTFFGVSPNHLVRFSHETPEVVGVGANCGLGYANVELLAEEFRAANPQIPVLMKLNAGMPNMAGVHEDATQENARRYARAMMERNVQFVGGCCGTTPSLIQAMADELQN